MYTSIRYFPLGLVGLCQIWYQGSIQIMQLQVYTFILSGMLSWPIYSCFSTYMVSKFHINPAYLVWTSYIYYYYFFHVILSCIIISCFKLLKLLLLSPFFSGLWCCPCKSISSIVLIASWLVICLNVNHTWF